MKVSPPTDANSNGTTNITLGGADAPTVSVGTVTVNETEASATVTAKKREHAEILLDKFFAMPAAGWQNAGERTVGYADQYDG